MNRDRRWPVSGVVGRGSPAMRTTNDPGAGRDLLDVFGRTADGMAAIDDRARIVAWNEAASRLLGFSAEDAIGRACSEVLAWHDGCGNAVCDTDCRGYARAAAGELLEAREVMGRTRGGDSVWLSVSTLVAAPASRSTWRLVHFMREASLPPRLGRMLADRLVSGGVAPAASSSVDGDGQAPDGDAPARHTPLDALTARERDVLRLLMEGAGTGGIAARLGVSRATARNHIQHLMDKLDAHSRLEAVAVALKHRS